MQKIRFGGDYNPEQWPAEVWERDLELFETACIDTLTVNVFSWGTLQPDEHTYNFGVLDRILARLDAGELDWLLGRRRRRGWRVVVDSSPGEGGGTDYARAEGRGDPQESSVDLPPLAVGHA